MNQLQAIFNARKNTLKNATFKKVPKAQVLMYEVFKHDFEYIDMANTYEFTHDDIAPFYSLV